MPFAMAMILWFRWMVTGSTIPGRLRQSSPRLLLARRTALSVLAIYLMHLTLATRRHLPDVWACIFQQAFFIWRRACELTTQPQGFGRSIKPPSVFLPRNTRSIIQKLKLYTC